MIKSEDIYKIKELGYDYITSIGKPSIQKLIDDKDSQIQLSLFFQTSLRDFASLHDEDLQEVIENDTRYIVRQNPIRRDEIRDTRESKITRLEQFINDKKEYYNTHYRAKKETLINNVDKKISSLKLSKFVSYKIIYKEGDITIKNKKGEEEIKSKDVASIEIIIDEKVKKEIEQLDGCYVVTTSLIDTTKHTKEDIHQAYKTLIKVENAFKTLKTEFLEIRPLYLKTDKRIKGHIALSMLAYNITLKLKSYTNEAKLDFKSIIRKLSTVKTVINTINSAIKFETIPTVCENLQSLFLKMNIKFPTKI
jgi:transposase